MANATTDRGSTGASHRTHDDGSLPRVRVRITEGGAGHAFDDAPAMSARPPLRHRLRRGHRLVAALVLNTLVLALAVEGVLAVAFGVRDRQTAVSLDLYAGLDDATLATLYPDQSRADVNRLWQELV